MGIESWRASTLLAAGLVLAVGLALAEEAEKPKESGHVECIEVRSRGDDGVGVARSANEGATGREELECRPILRAGEIVETVPGLIATQHSGGGKANQYFLRGFNLDHGTDLSLRVDAVPVNMPSHGHGQGYADLNFLIPELIDHVAFRKGPYRADDGDFSAAGSVRVEYIDRLPDPLVIASLGGDGYLRLLLADSVEVKGGTLLAAIEYDHYDGPWIRPDDFRKANLLARYTHENSTQRHTLTFSAYDGKWNATDQVPLRAINSETIGRFGGLDPFLGGDSSRYSLAWQWSHSRHPAETNNYRRRRNSADSVITEANAYLLHYDFNLVSNFTYFLDDPEGGDEFLQYDNRWVWGAHLAQSRPGTWGSHDLTWRYGAEARNDDIDNGLLRSNHGEATAAIREDGINQLSVGVWAEAELRWTPWFRTITGLRGDYVRALVHSDLRENSGRESDQQISPKFSAILGPWRGTEFYLNCGRGFHSNDARGATVHVDPQSGESIPRVDFLVQATGVDLGIRTNAVPGLRTSLSYFQLDIDSELLFIGDAGGTEASRPSRRRGVEWTNYYRMSPFFGLDLDLSWTRPRFRDRELTGNHIPGAIEQALAAGISFGSMKQPGVFGSLRWRYFGPRSLVEDNSVRSDSTSLVNARVGWALRRGLRLTLDIFNLLDREDCDIAYYYESRLEGESAEGVPDIHVHPMEARTIRLIASWHP